MIGGYGFIFGDNVSRLGFFMPPNNVSGSKITLDCEGFEISGILKGATIEHLESNVVFNVQDLIVQKKYSGGQENELWNKGAFEFPRNSI